MLEQNRVPDKQVQIERELERFRLENLSEIEDLPRDLRDVLDCIHRRMFDSELNVNEIRAQYNLRNNNISTRFRWALGVSIRQYIEAWRLEAAAHVLQLFDVEIYLIAMSVGYQHAETFNRAFRRWFDCTPSEFRARYVEEPPDGESREESVPASIERAPATAD